LLKIHHLGPKSAVVSQISEKHISQNSHGWRVTLILIGEPTAANNLSKTKTQLCRIAVQLYHICQSVLPVCEGIGEGRIRGGHTSVKKRVNSVTSSEIIRGLTVEAGDICGFSSPSSNNQP
jgi:hypothetical protein